MKKSFFFFLGGFLLFLNLSSKQKPNIILFLVDDMGLMDTSAPCWWIRKVSPKSTLSMTGTVPPAWNGWPSRECAFSQFYAQSVCSPTRASLMTGQNSARHRVTQFISPESKNAGPEDWKWEGLTSKDTTLPPFAVKWLSYHFAGKLISHRLAMRERIPPNWDSISILPAVPLVHSVAILEKTDMATSTQKEKEGRFRIGEIS